MLSKRKFWNQKILSWEKSKYETKHKFYDVNRSVKQRLLLARSVIHQMPEGTNLLELGCGSGQLWENIKSLKLNYKGVDFSEIAINAFKKRTQTSKVNSISLFCEDCLKNKYAANVVISLGLLDWLSHEEIRKLVGSYRNTWYLHSFSEKRFSLTQILHRLYVFMSYGYKTGPYCPNYYKAQYLLDLFGPQAKIYSDSKLSFGAFIYNLPPYVQFKIKN